MLAIQKNCCILAFEVNPWSNRPNPGKHGSGHRRDGFGQREPGIRKLLARLRLVLAEF